MLNTTDTDMDTHLPIMDTDTETTTDPTHTMEDMDTTEREKLDLVQVSRTINNLTIDTHSLKLYIHLPNCPPIELSSIYERIMISV
ncbi:FIP (Fungus-Induced Protein) Related [Caenorhabditis elegans]|uniref:FIP (Fungus-Induced Protein) Related n=1 Tax=Caenorhabditis elegans TaxID=6239 RepID=B5U8M6_CAEEL|nr:FIP (Fungus-Induced Protein) Related [Caenorhabditis elegans]CAR64666.1 FIP (Fungus-Induced Protein) Related [Caenorhabditis elegans]|eukprot:NP_001129894.1 FIP (Fungus-Induced Protein) Related [Caenorhabditis elegans]